MQQPRQIDTGFDRHSEGEITGVGWLGFRRTLQISERLASKG